MMVKARDREWQAGTACLYLRMGAGCPHSPVCIAACFVDPSEPWMWA